MSESREYEQTRSSAIHSSLVVLTVEAGKDGQARLVLDGFYMPATGFKPGDTVEAIVQPELISILPAE